MTKRAFTVIVAVLLSMVFIAPSIADRRDHSGAVYVMTNDPEGNEIAAYSRNDKGLLEFLKKYPTDGLGSGGGLDPLASQGSLILSPSGRWLFAVNAGSDDISVFRTRHGKLKLIGVFDSGGEFPVSLTIYHDLLYVLNAGGSSNPNITGFKVGHKGDLEPLHGSSRELTPGGYHQVGFDPSGDFLVITEGDPAGDNNIHVFAVDRRGRPDNYAVTSPSEGIVPFGFIFGDHGELLVSEAGSGAVTSYKILRDGSLKVINPSVKNGQTATCWIAGNDDGFVYTANTGSNTISLYELVSGKDRDNRRFDNDKKGFKPRSGKSRLELLDFAAGAGVGPIDLTTAGDGRFLYVLNGNNGSVGMFRINADGSLKDLGTIGGLPSPFAQGIAGQ